VPVGVGVFMDTDRSIAYFTMEIALDVAMPTYSGGLGILAGDTVRSAADLKVPMVAVTLLHRQGYFYQHLDGEGNQREEPANWVVEDFLEPLDAEASVAIEGRTVRLRAWRYRVRGEGGFEVPVLFLDATLPANAEWDRTLTGTLYGGDSHYRFCQEALLGIGGVRVLRALGFNALKRFHMNEGHASLLSLELLDEHIDEAGRTSPTPDDVEAVRRRCVFTTHTPVPAGHDRFPLDLVRRVLGDHEALGMEDVFCCEGELNMTFLALNLSRYVNGVAKRHGQVSRLMFPNYAIDWITNGVHAATWACPSIAALFDRHIAGWREDNFSLRYAATVPSEELWEAHQEAKRTLVTEVNRATNAGMDVDVFTIGFARRSAAYKRPDLLFRDLNRLKAIVDRIGPLQLVYAGKAHPRDESGKELIRHVFRAREALRGLVKVAYLENYDLELARQMIAGVDLWLNTPQPPLEASGTSGMKAAMNGVPSLSILDGWWLEGCIEGVTGWSIGPRERPGPPIEDDGDIPSLYEQLENVVMPTFYHDRDRYLDIMRQAITFNGSFFNTQRMVQQYAVNAYLG